MTGVQTCALPIYYMDMKKQKLWKIVAVGLLLSVVEFAFLFSNLAKFEHGGWFPISIAAFLFLGLFIWYRAKLLRQQYLSYVDFEPFVPMLKDLMNDDSIAKEATNLVYLAMSGDETKIDNNIVYSIFRKRPKRADIYWFVHVDIVDEPYLTKYKVRTLIPGKVFFVKLKFGFKVEHKVNLMFSKIVKEMQAAGEVDELSH